MKRSRALEIASWCTGVPGGAMVIIGIFVVENIPLFVTGWIIVLVSLGLGRARYNAILKELISEMFTDAGDGFIFCNACGASTEDGKLEHIKHSEDCGGLDGARRLQALPGMQMIREALANQGKDKQSKEEQEKRETDLKYKRRE